MRNIHRRSVLRGLGGVAIGLPLLASLERRAHALAPPKRLVIVYTPIGTVLHRWLPITTGSGFELGELMQPLAPHKDALIILDGVDNEASYHSENVHTHPLGMATVLTGIEPTQQWAGGISVDQFIANAIGDSTKFASLEFGVQVGVQGNMNKRLSYKGKDEPVPPEDDPSKVFERIFGDFTADPLELDKLHAEKRIVLDAVADDIARLQPRLDTADKQRLDEYLTAVLEIEKKLDLGGAGCSPPEPGGAVDFMDPTKYPQVGDLQTTLLVNALACDLTRVATLHWGGMNMVLDWLGMTENHHVLSHDEATKEDQLITIYTWYAERFAALLAAMKEKQEADGSTLLDNSVIVWVTENHPGHGRRRLPFLMAGSCGGYFETGRHLKYGAAPPVEGPWHDGMDVGGGAFHNDLLVSLCNAMGLDDVTSFGNPAYCTGPLAQLV
jgi:hypothetical protein